MIEDCLKLTTWFGERDRTGNELVADALLEIYGRRELAAGILLRGIEGFGLKHRLRTDRLLTLSEDLPVAAIAIDRPEKIEAALDDVMDLRRHGLVTLERARLLTGHSGFTVPAAELPETVKLTLYLGRREQSGGRPAWIALCDLLRDHGVAGATALLGVDGIRQGRRLRARFFDRNADVPVMLIAVGSGDRIKSALPEVRRMLEHPLASLERVHICKRDGQLLRSPPALPETDERGREIWQKLMVYTGEAATHEGFAIHRQIIRRLRADGASGATALRGFWGYHGDHAPHGDRLLQLRRHVPVVTTVVDSPGRIAASFRIIDELTRETGLVTSEMVPAMSALADGHHRGGTELSRHHP